MTSNLNAKVNAVLVNNEQPVMNKRNRLLGLRENFFRDSRDEFTTNNTGKKRKNVITSDKGFVNTSHILGFEVSRTPK